MKALKLTIAALMLAFTFQAAQAQVRVGVHVGTPPPRREVVVVRHPVHREVIVRHRPHYRHHYYRHNREVVVRRHY